MSKERVVVFRQAPQRLLKKAPRRVLLLLGRLAHDDGRRRLEQHEVLAQQRLHQLVLHLEVHQVLAKDDCAAQPANGCTNGEQKQPRAAHNPHFNWWRNALAQVEQNGREDDERKDGIEQGGKAPRESARKALRVLVRALAGAFDGLLPRIPRAEVGAHHGQAPRKGPRRAHPLGRRTGKHQRRHNPQKARQLVGHAHAIIGKRERTRTRGRRGRVSKSPRVKFPKAAPRLAKRIRCVDAVLAPILLEERGRASTGHEIVKGRVPFVDFAFDPCQEDGIPHHTQQPNPGHAARKVAVPTKEFSKHAHPPPRRPDDPICPQDWLQAVWISAPFYINAAASFAAARGSPWFFP